MAYICYRKKKAYLRYKKATVKPVKFIKPTFKRLIKFITANFNFINLTEPFKVINETVTAVKIQLFCPFYAHKYNKASIVRHISEKKNVN